MNLCDQEGESGGKSLTFEAAPVKSQVPVVKAKATSLMSSFMTSKSIVTDTTCVRVETQTFLHYMSQNFTNDFPNGCRRLGLPNTDKQSSERAIMECSILKHWLILYIQSRPRRTSSNLSTRLGSPTPGILPTRGSLLRSAAFTDWVTAQCQWVWTNVGVEALMCPENVSLCPQIIINNWKYSWTTGVLEGCTTWRMTV